MKFLFLMIITSLIVGCSSSQSKDSVYVLTEKTIDQDLYVKGDSELRLYRSSALLMILATVDISIDGEYVASLSNASAATIKLLPGAHRVESKMGILDAKSGCGLDFDIAPGEVLYISAAPAPAGLLPAVSILFNPVVCKFDLEPVAASMGLEKYSEFKRS